MKLLTFIVLLFFWIQLYAEDIPDQNASGMRKVLGAIADVNQVPTSTKGGNGPVLIGNLPVDIGVLIVDGIFNTRSNYVGFSIYHVKVNDSITLEVASREAFKDGDCVVVWYRNEMGDSPNLSMLGDAGIKKSKDCRK